MQRLDRRIRILRGKRQGAFDPDQHFLGQAFRARAARKVRLHLRRQQPVILITPRWSQGRAFLDDVGVDLALGSPAIHCRTLSMAPMLGHSVHDAWTWLVRAVVEFCGVPIEGPVAQAVDRHGFRHVMRELFKRVRTGPRRALLIHQVEQLEVEARDDLIRVFTEHADAVGPERRINLLLACSVDAPSFDLRGAERVFLPDYTDLEAREALVELAGPSPAHDLQYVVGMVGGVPAFLERLGAEAEQSGGRLPSSRDELWKALGPLADEVRGAISILNTDDRHAERFDEVLSLGPVPFDPERDPPLLRAGVLQEIYGGLSAKVMVRAPLFAELAMTA